MAPIFGLSGSKDVCTFQASIRLIISDIIPDLCQKPSTSSVFPTAYSASVLPLSRKPDVAKVNMEAALRPTFFLSHLASGFGACRVGIKGTRRRTKRS